MIKIFFDHFPKTAGTSLHQFFTEAFGEDAVSPPLKGMRLETVLSLYRQKIVVAGHFHLHPENCLPKGYLTATILRNPRERTLSEYFYLGSSRIHVESNAEVHHFRTHSFLTGYQVQDTARWESKIQ